MEHLLFCSRHSDTKVKSKARSLDSAPLEEDTGREQVRSGTHSRVCAVAHQFESVYSLLRQFHKYLLSTYCVPGIGNTAVDKPGKFYSWSICCHVMRKTVNKRISKMYIVLDAV